MALKWQPVVASAIGGGCNEPSSAFLAEPAVSSSGRVETARLIKPFSWKTEIDPGHIPVLQHIKEEEKSRVA